MTSSTKLFETKKEKNYMKNNLSKKIGLFVFFFSVRLTCQEAAVGLLESILHTNTAENKKRRKKL